MTFSVITTETYYQTAGYSDEQLQSFSQIEFISPETMKWGIVLWAAIVAAYLFYIRQYFTPLPSQDE